MSIPNPRLLPLALAALAAVGLDFHGAHGQVALDPSAAPRPGWIGVGVHVNEVRQATGRVETDLVITRVVDGSPADRAGFRPGDRILQINGRGVTLESFASITSGLREGDRIRVTVARGPWPSEIDVQAVARPAPELVALPHDVALRVDSAMLRLDSLLWLLGDPAISAGRSEATAGYEELGRQRLVAIGADSTRTVIVPTGNLDPVADPSIFRERERAVGASSADVGRLAAPHIVGQNRVAGAAMIVLNRELAAYFEVAGGLLVTDVTPGTPAEDAGIRPGDVVVRVDDGAVASLADLRRAMSAEGNRQVVSLVRRGEPIDVIMP